MTRRRRGQLRTRVHVDAHAVTFRFYENVNPDPEGATGARYTSRTIRALCSLRPPFSWATAPSCYLFALPYALYNTY